MTKRTRLQRAIFEDGRTAREIAAAAEVSESNLSLVTTGKRMPCVWTAQKLAAVLNTTPEALGFPYLPADAQGGAA